MTARRDPIMIPGTPFRALAGADGQGTRSSVTAGQRRRTGIEPAGDAERRPPVLKTGGATRHPHASGPDVTRQPERP